MNEARLHPRFLLHATADVLGEEIVLKRPLADISLGGCRFIGRGWESEGATLQLIVSFADLDVHLPLCGRVVRSTERDMGIRFIDLDDEQRWGLRKHIRDAQSARHSEELTTSA